MIITICGKNFNTDNIISLHINESTNRVFIDTDDDFFNLIYRSEEDIVDARRWIKLQTLTLHDLHEAMHVIVSTCNYFINTSNQCALCPIKRSHGCFFLTIPNNWR